MFRARFTDAFPRSLANFGPQELERDVVDIVPGYGVDDIPGLAWSLSERREGVGNYSDFHALYNLPGHLQNPVQTGLGDILPLVYLNYLLSGSPDHLGY